MNSGAPMPGLFFNLTERWVIAQDETRLAAVLARAGAATVEPWLDSSSYPRAELLQVLDAAAVEFAMPRDALVLDIAQWSASVLLRRYAALVAGLSSPVELLEVLSDSIYPQLCRMLGRESQPQLQFSRLDANRGRLSAPADRLMALALQGVLQGLAAHYRYPLQLDLAASDGETVLALNFGAPE